MVTSLTYEAKTRTELLCTIHELPPSALLTPKQAAAYLNTTTGVLANWRSSRRGPRYHGAHDFIRYRLQDLDSWVSQRADEIRSDISHRPKQDKSFIDCEAEDA